MNVNDYKPRHEDQLHLDAQVIYAFDDVVGIACDDDCAQDAVDDVNADYGEGADAGYGRATNEQVRLHRHCMACGTLVSDDE